MILEKYISFKGLLKTILAKSYESAFKGKVDKAVYKVERV